MRLTLATYNIHGCIGRDGIFDPDRILQVLRELNADVVALQEVDSREHRGLEVLQCLAEGTGMTPVAGPTLLRHERDYGNALMSRLKIREVRRLNLSLPPHEPRGALDVDLECQEVTLQVIATHLGLNPAERRAQVQQLLERFAHKHCVLMGDLNEWFLWGRPLRWLKAIFGRSPEPRTFPCSLPDLCAGPNLGQAGRYPIAYASALHADFPYCLRSPSPDRCHRVLRLSAHARSGSASVGLAWRNRINP